MKFFMPSYSLIITLTGSLMLFFSSGCSERKDNNGLPEAEPGGREEFALDKPELIARKIGAEIANAVEKAMPSVVVVRTEETRYLVGQDLFWRHFYRIPRRLAGQGSGVIISSAGHVLTCNHVIRNAQEIEVVLPDGTPYPASFVGEDNVSDLAVLKIDSNEKFIPIESADSDKVRIGEFVVAIGSPFSLSSSVTVGIISQKGRAIGLLPYEDFIQTDAPINPGNSGGPLVDVEGRLVGINSAIQTSGSDYRGNIGIAFAIPSNLAMDVATSIITKGYYERPRLGIIAGQLNPSQSQIILGRKSGVFVDTVFRNSPAAEVGLEEGDIIKEVDGKIIKSIADLQRSIIKHQIGEPVKLVIIRGTQEMNVTVQLKALPD